jgi:hypothetical protein
MGMCRWLPSGMSSDDQVLARLSGTVCMWPVSVMIFPGDRRVVVRYPRASFCASWLRAFKLTSEALVSSRTKQTKQTEQTQHASTITHPTMMHRSMVVCNLPTPTWRPA